MNDPTPAARRVALALDESSVARELFHALSLLLGIDPSIVPGPADGGFGVIDPASGDVIGAGESVAEALEEALATARSWEGPDAITPRGLRPEGWTP